MTDNIRSNLLLKRLARGIRAAHFLLPPGSRALLTRLLSPIQSIAIWLAEEMALSATAVTEVTLKDAQKLPLGSVLMFKFGTAPAMLIHHQDGRWVSLTAVCTHLGCTVQYEPQADASIAPATGASTTRTPAPM